MVSAPAIVAAGQRHAGSARLAGRWLIVACAMLAGGLFAGVVAAQQIVMR
jgi:hypothetical protein